MLQPTKKLSRGFTLLELLVAVTIMGGIGIVAMQSLYSIFTVRSKQESLETTASSSRAVFTTITAAILQAAQIAIPSATSINVTGTPCRAIRYNSVSKIVEQALDLGSPCSPPTTGSFDSFTPAGVTINAFSVTKSADGAVTVSLSGTFKDVFGSHDFNYQTSVVPRVTI